MIPDYLIYDDLRRRSEKEWEPERLELPLYAPKLEDDRAKSEDVVEENRGVIIIDMNTGLETSE